MKISSQRTEESNSHSTNYIPTHQDALRTVQWFREDNAETRNQILSLTVTLPFNLEDSNHTITCMI